MYTAFIGLIGVYSCGITFFFDFRDHNSLPLEVRLSKINVSIQVKDHKENEDKIWLLDDIYREECDTDITIEESNINFESWKLIIKFEIKTIIWI